MCETFFVELQMQRDTSFISVAMNKIYCQIQYRFDQSSEI